jgi:hypothetical protein
MEIQLTPECEAQLSELARRRGKDPAAIAGELVALGLEEQRNTPGQEPAGGSSGQRLTQEDGVWVLRTGLKLSATATDEVLRRVRDERSEHHLSS